MPEEKITEGYLKPCPFCRGDAVMQAPNMHGMTCITCKRCMVSTKWGAVEDVVEAWNRRDGEDGEHEAN